ncbi:ABC phosphonate transporter periplasmic phosphonate-binding protein [Gottschalkia acidurici 9a]|uniref:ABC phosphonate transporter periplasmic phosphonate-binding protein n=1 Tax=Gottschalkia acidurici (strain ATCC 7906 / DSM 604 / BCRC 14475 / CIP 104303 / KCTC 5404 / NCIMB 10678 / 9a) TaxID=1128398 RepID=K0AXC2_GOTA9|nr:putative selenate ABC transporter substrate-binding protein [Gottschalkia acidurici]AFS77096.1 ABC phosphonate transporter periplasmic phosphonate-binding protein [Gottschalkia acidurici 9a]
MKKVLAILLSMLTLISFTACSVEKQESSENKEQTGKSGKEVVFRIGAIPDQNVSELNKSMETMAKYLSKETGLKVEFVPSVDYASLVTGFERGEIQLVWFGGLTGVQARAVAPGSNAIAQRPIDAEFQSVFIAQKDLDIAKLEDLKGKTFTFGSESSTSGSLMPRYFLTQSGVDPDKDFDGAPNYSGSHDKTIKLVETGAFQTGALNISVWNKLVEEKKVDLEKVKVFYTTPEYFDYNWTINNADNIDKVYGEGTREKVKEAILAMSAEKGSDQEEILRFFQTDKFVETKNENYKAIEEVGKSLGMVK